MKLWKALSLFFYDDFYKKNENPSPFYYGIVLIAFLFFLPFYIFISIIGLPFVSIKKLKEISIKRKINKIEHSQNQGESNT